MFLLLMSYSCILAVQQRYSKLTLHDAAIDHQHGFSVRRAEHAAPEACAIVKDHLLDLGVDLRQGSMASIQWNQRDWKLGIAIHLHSTSMHS